MGIERTKWTRRNQGREFNELSRAPEKKRAGAGITEVDRSRLEDLFPVPEYAEDDFRGSGRVAGAAQTDTISTGNAQ